MEVGERRTITFRAQALPIRPGEYDLGVRVVDRTQTVVLDQCDRLERLMLHSDLPKTVITPRFCSGEWADVKQ
jgi:hypothetical protein